MKNMDFLEIQNLYGFDQQKAHEAAKEYPPMIYPAEMIQEEMNRVGLETIKCQPAQEIAR